MVCLYTYTAVKTFVMSVVIYLLRPRQTAIAKFLVQCGADIGKVTHRGYTAYDFASEMLDTDMMHVFVEAQVSVFSVYCTDNITAIC